VTYVFQKISESSVNHLRHLWLKNLGQKNPEGVTVL